MSEYESVLQTKVINAIRDEYGNNVWYFKANDQVRVGLPDLFFCFYGHFVAIELKRHRLRRKRDKRTGEIDLGLEKLQEYNVKKINEAGGSAFAADNVPDIMKRLEKIRATIMFEKTL